ncbi:uncharacterized protein LOC144862161 [Branchiostoma floridae x Branchiostoma japonicum]
MAHEPRSDRHFPAVGLTVCSLAVSAVVLLFLRWEIASLRPEVGSLRERLAVLEDSKTAEGPKMPEGPKTPEGVSAGDEKDKDEPRIRSRRQDNVADIVTQPTAHTDFKATFTTLGATGRLGPTKLGQHYHGQDHAGLVTLENGIQHFTVKHAGTYRIEVAGAAAGWGLAEPNQVIMDEIETTSGKTVRGKGALMKGTFELETGEVLKILVGQEGVQDIPEFGAGGGGGTFVTKQDNTPLIIAGGGGGGCCPPGGNAASDGTKETTGNTCLRGSEGGKNGAGAGKGVSYEKEKIGVGMLSGGGGGLLTDGGGRNGGKGGRAFVNGGEGGRGAIIIKADGGFGGGGGGNDEGGGGGGGGGYSGGGRSRSVGGHCGGGGGSFNSGRDASGKSGANDGPGYVIFTLTTK